MTKRAPKPLPPPTASERAQAFAAAAALRDAIADPATMGKSTTGFVDLGRPRRGEQWTTWSGLPGFARIIRGSGRVYIHNLLPGWEYARDEIISEMIPDLEALAERGVRPMQATRGAQVRA